MGLVSRLVDTGDARLVAITMATELANFPWPTLLADRDSLLDGTGRSMEEGLRLEADRGREVFATGAQGAKRFAEGKGRHGE